MKDKDKYTEVEGAKLFIKELINEWEDEDGEVHKEFQWRKADMDINLGSLKKPKKGIYGFRYEFPQPQRGNVFKGFLTGGKK